MASLKGRRNSGKTLITIALLTVLTCSCSISRVYVGSEVRDDPKEKIKIGSTSKGEILEIFGPPDRIQKQYDGDIFVYAFLRKNSSMLIDRRTRDNQLHSFPVHAPSAEERRPRHSLRQGRGCEELRVPKGDKRTHHVLKLPGANRPVQSASPAGGCPAPLPHPFPTPGRSSTRQWPPKGLSFEPPPSLRMIR